MQSLLMTNPNNRKYSSVYQFVGHFPLFSRAYA
jgi:hypothetical protein